MAWFPLAVPSALQQCANHHKATFQAGILGSSRPYYGTSVSEMPNFGVKTAAFLPRY